MPPGMQTGQFGMAALPPPMRPVVSGCPANRDCVPGNPREEAGPFAARALQDRTLRSGTSLRTGRPLRALPE
jgi:hypothetical protein